MWSVKSVLVFAIRSFSLNYGFAVIMTDWCKSPGADYDTRYGEYFGTVIDSRLTLYKLAQLIIVFLFVDRLLRKHPFGELF